MSGAWAREADAVILADWERLDRAAMALGHALIAGDGWKRKFWLNNASAIIRRERKRLDEVAPRTPDWTPQPSDDYLIWAALAHIAACQTVDAAFNGAYRAYHVREAEAALRTLHKRGRS